MRRYETIFIVRPNAGEDEINEIISKSDSIINQDGGTVIKVDKWGLKKLAYLIKKENQGHYVHLDYAGQPASVMEMERIFRIDDRVLKYMTVKLAKDCDPVALKAEAEAASQAATAAPAAPETEAAAAPAEA